MTIEECQQCILGIAEQAALGDHEMAHIYEAQLREDVLRAIAAGLVDTDTAKQLATLALSTDEIQFHRWFA